jgi:putative phage-type endonuclease
MSLATTTDRDLWLKWRLGGIGASEAHTALFDPLALYCRKLGLVPDEEPTREMRIGLALEGAVLRLYCEETGAKIEEEQVCAEAAEYRFIRATLDAYATRDGDLRPVEAKTISGFAARRQGFDADDPESIPDRWLLQLQQQMLVTESDSADLAVLLAGHDFRVWTFERNDGLIAEIIAAEGELWQRIQRQDPPPPTAETDARVFAWLHPRSSSEIVLDETAADLVALYEEASERQKEFDARRDELKARILGLIGEHGMALLPDGTTVKRSVADVKERVQTVKAHKQTRLYIKHPE